MMKLFLLRTTGLALFLHGLADGAESKCAFQTGAEPVEFTLPPSALSHPLLDLPIEFRGVAPIVTRKQLKHGEPPKVTIERYSSTPDIYYDEGTGRVVVGVASCLGNEVSSSSIRSLPYAVAFGLGLLHPKTRPLCALLAVAMGVSHANAHSEACMPVVQVVVQAPSAYQGAVETCYEEIDDPAICPDPFPTYPTCNDPSPSCTMAVVGAGAGGLYTAMRMVDEGKISGEDICVFEMTERVGGRLFSLRGLGPNGDLSVDAGGYRTWPEFTPTLHALITDYLKIPMDCYDDSVPCQVFNIVDTGGRKDGFATFVETMMEQLVAVGACWYPYHELTSFAKTSSGTTELSFANGVTATVEGATILNIPQRPLLNVIRNSNLDEVGLLDATRLDALHSVQTVIATKFYLYYPKGSVFWRKLGIVSGDFESDGDARSMLLAGRYHDGHVECDDENDPDTCHGFLLAVYANDLSGNKAQFFRRYQRVRPEPVTFIAPSDLEGRELLLHAHQRLMDYHLYENTDAPYSGFEAQRILSNVVPPEFGILSTWNIAIPWSGGAWHSWTDLSKIETAQQQPFASENIYIVNEAYSLLQGWAEGSLKIADQVLEDHLGVPRGWDFENVDFAQVVRQTNSRECVEQDGTSSSSGGGGSQNSTSSGGGGNSAVLCFTEDALVEMADGSLRQIKDVQKGDFVATGTGLGRGLVTEALVHPVNRNVAIATVATKYGELVGTPDHPILVKNKHWVEIADLSSSEDHVVSLEDRFVSSFYNLEVDGDVLEESSHSYVVNGVVASGLGDNKVLNQKFPRQKVWKDAMTAADK